MKLARIATAVVIAVVAVSSLGLGAAAQPAAPPSDRSATALPAEVVLLAGGQASLPQLRILAPAAASKGVQWASFSINWNEGCDYSTGTWSTSAQAAFQYAVSIWASLIQSSQTMEVDACWCTDMPAGVLGSAGPRTVHASSSFPFDDTWYAAALANDLSGYDRNGDVAEIRVQLSSTWNWYLGTDGNPGHYQYDLASVALHELCHGLGFIGVMYVDGGYGYNRWGTVNQYPAVYDQFTEDGDGNRLLYGYSNGSLALGEALKGNENGVYFDGPNADQANGGPPVKLHAPGAWIPGSSYSHVDNIYDATPNALMTWSLNMGEVQHDPGPITLGMLEDMGWTLGPVDVTILKQVLGGGTDLAPGDPVTMTLSIGNTGNVTTTAVLVTDTLSSDILSPSYEASLTITPTGGISFAWSLPDLPPGASEVITIYGTINPSLPSDFAIVNTASISVDETEDDTDNNSSTAIIGGKRVSLPLVLRSY
jgi:uncharacterized repeat protein (TIGR01451 family)